MTEQQGQNHTPEQATKKKRPYVKPAIVSEPIYETMALACGKLPGESSFCNAAPKRS
jgi:hypothetical protein